MSESIRCGECTPHAIPSFESRLIMYQACVNPYAYGYALWRLQTAYKAGYNNLVILSL